jgi:hypothetical protein
MTTTRHTLVGAALIACAMTLASCNDPSATPSAQDAHDHADDHSGHDHADSGVRTDSYEGILGEIASLPGDMPGEDMQIRHEHIPGFKSESGEVHVSADGVPGMKSMTMPFPLGEGVSLDGYSVGDKVRFSFRVNWGGDTPWELTAIEKIAPDTPIDYANTKHESPSDDGSEP